jgi:hypothetical protein
MTQKERLNMSKLKEAYYAKKLSKIIKNTSAKVTSDVDIQSPEWIFSLHINEKLHYDRERLQRLLNHWPQDKVNSYLTTLFSGCSLKDTIQLAKIDTIVDKLKIDLEMETDFFEKEFLKENLDYFVALQEDKKEYLVLDGQHRIEELVLFFSSKTIFNPTSAVVFQKEGESGNIDVKGKYDDLDEDVKDYLYKNTPLIVVTYHTGDLQELANIFITSNSMVAMSSHEKRILQYNQNNRWLNELCNHDTNVRSMFTNIGSGMTGEYDLMKKGDTLFTAEMLLWINDNFYENQSLQLDKALCPNRLNKKVTSKLYISDKDRSTTKKILKLMADGCAVYDETFYKKFSKSSLYNLFYTLAFFMQKNNTWGKSKNIAGSFEISNIEEFTKWFFNKEFARINHPDTYMRFRKPNGKMAKQMHDYSYAKHNADQKHRSKVCMKGEGGSKYDFSDYGRIRYLLEELSESMPSLVKVGIISTIGSRSGDYSRNELLATHGIDLSKSNGLHLDEIVPVKKGGHRTPENTRFVDAKTNMNDSDRTKKVS